VTISAKLKSLTFSMARGVLNAPVMALAASTVRSFLLIMLAVPACTAPDSGIPNELDPGPPLSKEDSAGIAALPVGGNYADTEVWKVENQWEERDTPNAQLAGIAWDANSGLNWDEKYARWVGSFEQIPAASFGSTIKITTPWNGKALPGPKLDCADVALMLRVSFAAWYHLPIYLVGSDAGTPVYFGHFGVRTAKGPWSKAPLFAKQLKDYSDMAPADYGMAWPEDKALRQLFVMRDDEQIFLGKGAHLGAYLDEIHLNKRAARLVLLVQMYLGSANLADSRNTYNLSPEALRTGDVLLFRRGTRIAGHTMVAVRVTPIEGGKKQVDDVYGNEPPEQPLWEEPGETYRNFTDDEGGGPSKNADGEIYSHLNGGLKRFRVAKAVGGSWMNTWMAADEASWINDTDYARIAARPATFATILGQQDPEGERDTLLDVIEQKREHLRQFPASCAARDNREQAFSDLYDLMAAHFSMTREQVDSTYRTREDYIFASLDYSKSRTCCWNSSTSAMYQIIMAYDRSLSTDKACVAPVVFMQRSGGYDPYASFAAKQGRAADWAAWHADEACPQAGATDDVLAATTLEPFCSLPPPPPVTPPSDSPPVTNPPPPGAGTAGPDGGL
jgi:hypothetical protein